MTDLKKEQLLAKSRKRKRLFLALGIILSLIIWLLTNWQITFFIMLLGFIINESYFSDHIFYSPKQDYSYNLAGQQFEAQITDNQLKIDCAAFKDFLADKTANTTILLAVKIKANLLGYLFDPYLKLVSDAEEFENHLHHNKQNSAGKQKLDQQYFEKGLNGLRIINLTGQNPCNLKIFSHFCRITAVGKLYVSNNPNLQDKRILIIAPHADDAEIAAFSVYHDNPHNTHIITISQGEIEADYYASKFKIDRQAASQIKGQLRCFDSVFAAALHKVNPANCIQLGYFCLRLQDMHANPVKAFTSLESGDNDIRLARQFNGLFADFFAKDFTDQNSRFNDASKTLKTDLKTNLAAQLPSNKDGICSWNNLIADLVFLMEQIKPQVIITPHPEFDAHPDHIYSTYALKKAVEIANYQADFYLLYANHLHHHDLLPLGKAGFGTPLPPAFSSRDTEHFYCLEVNRSKQINKTLSLLLMHDLQKTVRIKTLLRRALQILFTNRRWNYLFHDEYLRKAVRQHEIFWLRKDL